jgi:hypothetical protein
MDFARRSFVWVPVLVLFEHDQIDAAVLAMGIQNGIRLRREERVVFVANGLTYLVKVSLAIHSNYAVADWEATLMSAHIRK